MLASQMVIVVLALGGSNGRSISLVVVMEVLAQHL